MNTTTDMNRRSFIRRSGTVATAFAAPYFIPSGLLARDGKPGANDRIVMAGIGIGGRSTDDLNVMLGQPDVQFVAILSLFTTILSLGKFSGDANQTSFRCRAGGRAPAR